MATRLWLLVGGSHQAGFGQAVLGLGINQGRGGLRAHVLGFEQIDERKQALLETVVIEPQVFLALANGHALQLDAARLVEAQ